MSSRKNLKQRQKPTSDGLRTEVNETVGSSVLLAAAVRQALDAIVKHRNCIHGPDYDYEKDECYEPEAKLYRVIPKLKKVLGEK
jgi:hypothetical protein